MNPRRSAWSPPLVVACVVLATVAVVLAERFKLLPIRPVGLPPIAAGVAFLTALACVAAGSRRSVIVVYAAGWLAAGVWAWWATVSGWTTWVWVALTGGTAVFTGLTVLCRPAPGPAAVGQGGDVAVQFVVQRSSLVRRWEALIRHLSKKQVVVTDVVPWEVPADGCRVYLNLPLDMTLRQLEDIRENLQGACHLRPGCVIRLLEGEHQGAAILDVMLRDCLADGLDYDETTEAASINDVFPIAFTPRGELLDICLRSQSMVIGGAPDAGKTTLLHRIIMWLARCVDTLIWVVDLNGGGLAQPWLVAWANGLAGKPTIDWVADCEEEAAVLLAVASAVAKDRKTSPVAVRRRRAANTTVLPVDKDLPAIIVLTDEGGEVRQAASLLGQLAMAGISRLAQIGRAEAVRVIMSVLRGTTDLLDRAMKVNAALRLCLRMNEDEEYGYVLGANPGRTRLIHKGSGYLLRAEDLSPIFCRTVNVLLDQIERHSIATWELRPDLDERARKVAARIRTKDVLDGRDPPPEILALPVMQDVEAGRAYEGRWERMAVKLAQLRGEDIPDEEPEPAADTPPAAPATPAVGGTALAALTMAAGITPQPARPADDPRLVQALEVLDGVDSLDDIDWGGQGEPSRATVAVASKPQETTARATIRAILAEVHPAALTSDEIGKRLEQRMGKSINRTYRQGLLKRMKEDGELRQDKDGAPYRLAAKP